MATRLPNVQGAMVPINGPSGEVQWQAWAYGELLQHLNNDLQLDPSAVPPLPQLTWNAIPYLSNWQASSVGAEFGTPGYAVDAFNIVRFTGEVAPIAVYGYGLASGIIARMPSALVPTKTIMQFVFGQDSTAAYFIARLDIAGRTTVAYTPGDVRVQANITGANNGLPGYVNMNTVTYPLGAPQ